MTCFACEQEPTQQCPRCGRPYCDDHGEDVCDACLEPSSGLPSFTLYRGSLLALLIGTALAVWLILQPPGDGANSAAATQIVTPTQPAAAQPTPTTQPAIGGGNATPGAQSTPASSPTTPPAEETPESPDTTTYTIQAGDTLLGICSNLSTLDPTECVDQVLSINSITLETNLAPGDTLTIPLQ